MARQQKALKFAAFGCAHFPLHDPAATAWVVESLAKQRPDVVAFLGDGIEANAASQWDDAKELAIELATEYESLNAFLAAVRKAAPKAKLIYRAGNHEANVVRAGRIDKRIRSLCDWTSPKNLPELSHWSVGSAYNYCRRLGCSWLGPQICFSHGYETTDANAETEAMYFTRNYPYSLYIAAHTHRPRPVTQIVWKGLPMDRYTANVGCLRDLNPGYMERKRKWQWGHAMLVGEAIPLKSPRMCREWDAELKVLRMYDGEAA